MKKAFGALQDRPVVSVVLTRDSVAAGDDIDAPHEKTTRMPSFTDPVSLAREASANYLPGVAGTGHFWLCVLNGVDIAEIRTSGIKPLVNEAVFGGNNRIHFIYKSATY